MAQKETAYESTIKYGGYWKFSDLYTMAYDYLKGEGYSVNEGEYKEVSADTKEIQIKWEASKKVTDYFKYTITLSWHVTRLTDAEVEIDGKIKKMNKGDLKLAVKGILVKDYDGNWEPKPYLKFIRGIYEKFIIDSSIKSYGDKLGGEASGLVDEVKAFLKLST